MKTPAIMLALALCTGCALPMEEHGGAAPRPEPSDLTFMAGGAALNESLIALHVPFIGRLGFDALAVYTLRVPKWGGRYEGVAVTVPFGAYWPEAVHFVRTALRHPHHRCQYAGADGRVHEGWCANE